MTATTNLETRSVLENIRNDRGVETVPLDVAVEAVTDALGHTEAEATEAIKDTAEMDRSPFGDEIVRLPEPETPEVKTAKKESFDGDVATLSMKPGEETGDSFHFLPVHADVGHPLVPEDKPYYAREIEGTDRTDLDILGHFLSDGDYAVNIVGHAGVGKNAAINKLAAGTNTPAVRAPLSNDITYEDFVGTFVPREDGEGFTFRDGIATAAFRHGWWLVVDEINAAPPEILTALHQMTEENGEAELLIRETQEVVRPHPNFRFIATMNPEYAGTKPLNKAFASRFKHLEMDYLPADKEAKVLSDKTNLSSSDIRTLTNMAAKLRDRLKANDIESPVTPRHLIQIGREAEVMGLKGATNHLLLPYVDYADRDVVASVIDKFL